MSHRTVILSSFEEYLASENYPSGVEEPERTARLLRFPYVVVLQVSFAEVDFANRWCWQHFGPADGECLDRQSEYRVCDLDEAHTHVGKWVWHWLAKTDYNYGFNEWYFVERNDSERFLENIDKINWGENYPK